LVARGLFRTLDAFDATFLLVGTGTSHS
jgi:hypothetical protein